MRKRVLRVAALATGPLFFGLCVTKHLEKSEIKMCVYFAEVAERLVGNLWMCGEGWGGVVGGAGGSVFLARDRIRHGGTVEAATQSDAG